MTATVSSAAVPANDREQIRYDRFAQVARAARDNLSVGIDLVIVHNERTVSGRQPRASLNRAVVVAAVSAWDRFLADTWSAFTTSDTVEDWYAGAGQARKLTSTLFRRMKP